MHYGEKPWKYLKSYLDSKGKNISEIWWDYAKRTAEFEQILLKNRENIKDYLTQAGLGWLLFGYSKTLFGIIRIQLLLNAKEDSKASQIACEIPDRLFGLCLILGEMITFARNRKRWALSVFLKARKVKKAFDKYAHLAL